MTEARGTLIGLFSRNDGDVEIIDELVRAIVAEASADGALQARRQAAERIEALEKAPMGRPGKVTEWVRLREALAALGAGEPGAEGPEPLPENACGVMGLCERRKGHEGKHSTSVDRALAAAPPAQSPGLNVAALGLNDEQSAILRDLLASRQQTVSEWLSDVLMEMGLGRTTGKDYPPPMSAAPATEETP